MKKLFTYRISNLFAPLILSFFISAVPASAQQWIHPFDFPQSANCPDEVMAAVEIPAGSFIKYELDKTSGHAVVDRFLSVPMVYPANYGVISQTLAGDGDSLDVLVYTRSPIQSGALILVRPIGILKMLDGGAQDDKIIAVPATKVDPTYADIKKIEDLPAIERERLEFFFKTYKNLPAGSKKVEIGELLSPETAKKMIREAFVEYAESKKIEMLPCAEKRVSKP